MSVRQRLVASLDAMEAAGTALRWTRHLLPARHPEAGAWSTLVCLLDGLDGPGLLHGRTLALGGLRLLSQVGYALELEQCVVCERPCPESAPAFVDAVRGGIVCRACGGRGRLLDPMTRVVAARAQREDGPWLPTVDELTGPQAIDLLALVEATMAAHADLAPPR